MLSHVQLCDRMHCSSPDSPAMGFSRQEYWRGLPFPSPGDLPNSGIKLPSSALRQILYHGATWDHLERPKQGSQTEKSQVLGQFKSWTKHSLPHPFCILSSLLFLSVDSSSPSNGLPPSCIISIECTQTAATLHRSSLAEFQKDGLFLNTLQCILNIQKEFLNAH